MIQNRRKFISTIAAATASVPLLANVQSLMPPSDKKRYPLRLFSKPLDSYDFDFACETIQAAGISGIDLTVRPGGKVEPGEVESSLPKFIDKAQKYDLTTDMIVTGIVSASDPFTERILRTASSAGIKFYRMGWLDYDKKADIHDTIQKYKRDFSDLVSLNMKYKIHGGYQNHMGEKIGSPVWDLYELLGTFPPEYLGSQYDVRHAMVEGAESWILGMRLISGHIKTLAIKDFTWKTTGVRPEPVSVPLGEGMVDWDRYFGTIKELNIEAPITLHIEYPLLAMGEEKISLDKQQEIIVRKLKKDTEFINSFLKKYQLI